MRIAALALAALVAGPLHAQQGASQPPPAQQSGAAQPRVLEDQIDDQAVLTPDPRQSYIFFRATRKMGLVFLRETEAGEDEAERAEAFALAWQDHQELLADWRRRDENCRRTRCGHSRPAPEEPTPENAVNDLAPDRHYKIVYRNPTFTEEGPPYSYVLAVRPGRYILYGQRDNVGNAQLGVCLCMGSVRFDVSAGRVVDLGTVTYPALDAAGAREQTDSAFTDTGQASIAIVPPGPDARLPARLSALTMVPVQLRAAGKMSNLFGLHIDRHPALAGVLRYERDLVIDDSTGQAAAAGP